MGDHHQALQRLLAIMTRLRDPARGCPWDAKQDFASIAPYTLEEAYEVVDAVDRGDFDDLRDELGDLLFQVVFHARLAEEAGRFDFADVATAIADKLVRRHPHVFEDVHYANATEQAQAWEAIKAEERRRKGGTDVSVLAGIAHGLPPWRRSEKLQQRAARTGFEWPALEPVLDKLAEEIRELDDECRAPMPEAERVEDELGDVLFVLVNLARYAGVDFARALRHANTKFERRFRAMEAFAADDGQHLEDLSLDAQEALWHRAKRDGL